MSVCSDSGRVRGRGVCVCGRLELGRGGKGARHHVGAAQSSQLSPGPERDRECGDLGRTREPVKGRPGWNDRLSKEHLLLSV
eukprot:scaffold22657_cov45-Phaeocystis_antarctica.AAC.2